MTQPTTITAETAQQLWETLRANLLDARKAVTEIIETEAWKPLGYNTLREAWTDRMTGVEVNLVTATLVEVVYAMIDEGGTDMEIATAVKGIGPTIVATLRRQRENGVPAALATIRTPRQSSETGRDSGGTLFLHPGPERLAAWKLIAKQQDRALADLALEFLDDAFRGFDGLQQ